MAEEDEREPDWEITAEGLYRATRSFLSRRGYCCANRCSNCPYVNWRCSRDWRPVAPECVRRTRVSPKVIAAVRSQLAYHLRSLRALQYNEPSDDSNYHHQMARHYRLLLARWRG